MLNPTLWGGKQPPQTHLTPRGSRLIRNVGLVETQTVELFPEGLKLEGGKWLGPINVAYETYGTLSPARDNAILVCHAVSGGAHAAGFHEGDRKPGWWDNMIGPGKAIDTRRYFVICSNVLGSCYGTSGPSSIDPDTGRPFGGNFPVVTVRDMVTVQRRLMLHLGISRLHAVVGGSMGGMQALQWSVQYPEAVGNVIAIATTHRHSPQQIALNEVARQSIMQDPAWRGGNYYGTGGPLVGLALARMLGHVTYLSESGMDRKFGRRLQDRKDYAFALEPEFEVESYMRHQGESFVRRFDANSLLYLSKALDYFDLARGHMDLTDAFRRSEAKFLLISFTSDWLYPPHHLRAVARAIHLAGGYAEFNNIACDYGHDSFLLEETNQHSIVRSFLRRARQ